MRRLLAEQDADILRHVGSQDDLDELVTWTAEQFGLEE